MTEYIFTKHAEDMMKERNIIKEWIDTTLNQLDWVEDRTDGNKHYFKKIVDYGSRNLHIVVNSSVNPNKIVTLFFDRGAKKEGID
jgi:hypothetical protein